MMKKIYSYLGVLALIFSFGTLHGQVIAVEDFEDPNATQILDFPGWTTFLPPFNITTTNPCEGAQSVRRNMPNAGSNTYLQFLSSPSDAQSTGSSIEVSFEYKIVDATTGAPLPAGTNFGTIDLSYSSDGGTTWNVYKTIGQADLPTGDCTLQTDPITFPANKSFGWRLSTFWANGDWTVYVDNFKAIEQVACIQPINLGISSITTTSATVGWEDVNQTPATSYEVAYCTAPGTPPQLTCTAPFGGGTIIGITSLSQPLTGLIDGTQYYIYVRAVCGATSNSVWTGPQSFQTIAIGSDCSIPIVVGNPLPYNDIDQTDRFGADDYSGNPGGNCGGTNLLDGFEVVYQYTPVNNDILSIDVTGLTGTNVGVFVYEDCAAIGTLCFGPGGDTTTTGANLNINSLFVTGGQDYFIVIASTDATGNPANTDYTLDITGFDCATWVPPNLPPLGTPISFVPAVQTLADFSNTQGYGVTPTIEGAILQWYTDNNGSIGTPITAPLNTIAIADLDCFWVTQNIGTCQSPALKVCFSEFDCNTDLGGITATTTGSVCDSGTVTMTATAATSNIYWYDSATGGELLASGGSYTSPTITTTTSYWVTEVFLGQGTIPNQGNPGPTTNASSNNDNYGLTINAEQEFTIKDVQVFATGGGNVTLELTDGSGNTIHGPQVFGITPGTQASPTSNILTLDWFVDPVQAGTQTFYLRKVSGAPMLYVPASDANFPYSLGPVGEITDGADSNGTTGSYYYFFNWTVTGPKVLCEKSPRTKVDATVYTTKTTQVSADDMIVCLGSSTMLHVTSIDPDYVYTWTGTDGTGPLTGADVSVTVTQNTTYTVTAVNPITTCSFVNDISLEVKGAADLALNPDVELCLGETTQLTAGGLVYDFEQTPTGWTTANNSTVPGSTPPISVADWTVVNSPHGPLGITSPDNSKFYISEVNLLGPSATSETILTSPVISMVGVGSASVSFDHYLRHNFRHAADGELQVNVDNTGWTTMETYADDIGGSEFDLFQNFEPETADLTPYVGSTLQIRFKFSGAWGWYWAIDNVVITRNFLAGTVSWTPTTDLYFDDQATTPYTGTSTNVVYFKGSQEGTFTYTANLNIPGCSSSTANVIVTVYETDPPTTSATTQTFLYGETLGDLDVTGQDLKYYVLDANGDLDQVSVNTLLVNGTTYYISQTENGCEGATIAITVDQICTPPLNLDVIVAPDGSNAAQITATWDPPANLAGIQEYRIVITDVTSSNPNNHTVVYDDMVPLTRTFEIVDDLECDKDFELELFSSCDAANGVFGSAGVVTFNTANCLGTVDFRFEGLTYYPNPTPGVVYFDNALPIEKITVYDLSGKKIVVKNANATKVSMDFSNLASGTYFVAISVDGARKVVQVIRE